MPKQTKQTQTKEWTPEEIEKTLVNPLVTGMGGYPQIIDDEQYICVAKRFIAENGVDKYLRTMLDALDDCMDHSKFAQ